MQTENRFKRYRAKQKARGLVRVCIDVPADRVAFIKHMAAELRREHLKSGGKDYG